MKSNKGKKKKNFCETYIILPMHMNRIKNGDLGLQHSPQTHHGVCVLGKGSIIGIGASFRPCKRKYHSDSGKGLCFDKY